MRHRPSLLTLLLSTSASCSLVLGYGDYTEQSPSTSSSSRSSSSSSSGGGAGGESIGVGGAGGTAAICPDGGTPSIEICGNDIDEDCNGTTCNHEADWSRRFVDLDPPANDRAITALAVTGAEIAIAGWYNGTLDLGLGHTLDDSPSVDRELFAARLGTDGATKFHTPALGMPLQREPLDVALSASGSRMAVAGTVETGSVDGFQFFVQYSRPVHPGWVKEIGSTGIDRGTAIAFDGDNNVLVAGVVEPGQGKLSCAVGDVDFASSVSQMVVALLDEDDGSCLWVQSLAAPFVTPADVLIDQAGQVIVLGSYKGTIPGVADSTAAGASPFLLALDPANGAIRWIRAYPVTAAMSFASLKAMAPGGDGRLYLAGSLRGTATLGEKTLSSTVPNEEDVLVMAVDGSVTAKGKVAWAHRFGGTAGFKRATGIGTVAQSGKDDLFLAGLAAGAMSVEPDGDTGVLCPLGGVFLLKLVGEAPLWGDCFGKGGVDNIDIVRLANSGQRVVLAGARTLAIDFGNGSLEGTTFDAFAAQFSSP